MPLFRPPHTLPSSISEPNQSTLCSLPLNPAKTLEKEFISNVGNCGITLMLKILFLNNDKKSCLLLYSESLNGNRQDLKFLEDK